MMRTLTILTLCCVLASAFGCGRRENTTPAKKVKIGFIIPMADNEWYQLEWKFADEAAKQYNFELLKQLAIDGDKVQTALDNLSAQGAQGVIICSPDVKLGPSIVTTTNNHKMKLMSVDDQLVGGDGKFIAEVHHVGIQARKIGELVGQSLADEMKKRGWKVEDTAAMGITYDQLDTSKERTEGAKAILIKNGIPEAQIFMVARATPPDQNAAFNAANDALTAHANVKNWLVFSSNDDGVLGAVRAMEGKQYKAENIIGIGIDGTVGVTDLKREKPTGFFASVLLQPKLHGYGTAETMYKWINEGKEPELRKYTTGILITRENFAQEMKAQGLDPSKY